MSFLVVGLAGNSRVWADAAEDAYDLAAGYYKRDRWDLAAEGFKKFAEKYPQHPRTANARFFQGLSLINLNDLKGAREALRLFLRDGAENRNLAHAVYRIGECSYLLDELKAAEPELSTYVTKYPDDNLVDRATTYLADIQLRTQRPELALKTFQSVIEKFPTSEMVEDAKFGLARGHEMLKQVDQAIAIYREIANSEKSTRADEAQLNLGSRLYDQSKYAEAAQEFATFENKFPKSSLLSLAHLNHGYSLFEVDKFTEASKEFEQAALDPRQATEARYWRGQCFKSQGDYAQAATILKAEYEAQPKHPLAESILYHWADAEQKQGQAETARKLFLQVVEKFPQGELADDSLHMASSSAVEGNDLSLAEQLLDRFGKEYPNSGLRWHQELLRGRVRLMKNQPAEAVTAFEKIVKESQNETTKNWARYYLGYALLQSADPVAALEATAPLAELVAAQAQVGKPFLGVILVRGACQLAMANKEPVANQKVEMYRAAVASATMFLERGPQAKDADQALAIRALAAAHSGDKARSKSDLETLLKDHPKSPELERAVYEVAEVAYANEDWEWSGELFASLVTRGKEGRWFVPGLAGQAWSHYQRKQYPEALPLFTQIKTDFPQHKDAAEAAFMCGKCLQQQQAMNAEAAVAFQVAFDKFAPSKFAYLGGLERARLLRDAMQYPAADMAYAAVLEKFPQPEHLDKLLNEWALCNYAGENYARSDEIFKRLVKETPESDLADNAQLSLAESDLIANKLDQAKAQFLALADSEKSDEVVVQTARFQLIGLCSEKKEWEIVRVQAKKLLEKFPMTKHRWFAELHWGEADLNLKEAGPAAERLLQVVAQRDKPEIADQPWFPQAWILLAEAYFREKNYEAIDKTLKDCQAWKADLPQLYVLDEIQGRALNAQAKFPEALAAFQKVIDNPHGRRTETAAKAQFMIGEIYLRQKNFAQAEEEYLKVDILYRFPEWQAPALLQAAACQEELKKWKDAVKTYERMIKDFPTSEYTAMAKTRLPKAKQNAM